MNLNDTIINICLDHARSLINPLHDFRIEPYAENKVVIHPDSTAAKDWCYVHLNEDADRINTAGYLMTQTEARAVVASMRRDKLMSVGDVEEAQEELSRQYQEMQSQEDSQ